MILNKEKLSNVFLMLVIGALMIYLYVAQIQEMNAYLGMKAITINLEFIISLLIFFFQIQDKLVKDNKLI